MTSAEGESLMRKTIGVVVFLISVAVVGFAQVDTGSLVGTVKDASGALVPNVTVTATNTDTDIATATETEYRPIWSGVIT